MKLIKKNENIQPSVEICGGKKTDLIKIESDGDHEMHAPTRVVRDGLPTNLYSNLTSVVDESED